MGTFVISVADSRSGPEWINKEFTWEQLIKEFQQHFKRTDETLEEYLAMGKIQQGKIKDVGCFVGGKLNGKRNKTSILYRSLLTLDFDHCSAEIYEKLKIFFDSIYVNYCVYSTHKHEPEKPRLRVIIPLMTILSSGEDEYRYLSEKIVKAMELEDMIDTTSYQHCRLMYWGSVPKDQEYYFDYRTDGGFLDTSLFLEGFKDVDPQADPEKKTTPKPKPIKWKSDPLKLPGIIGAFCRTYSISRCVDIFLSDFYEKSDRKNRYTYKLGQGSSGLEIKDDDSLCQSYHETDPSRTYPDSENPRQCSSFDLILIHLFGNDQKRLSEALRWCVDQEGVRDDARLKKEIAHGNDIIWDSKHVKFSKGIITPLLSKINLKILFKKENIIMKYNELEQKKTINGETWKEDHDIGVVKDLCQEHNMQGVTRQFLEIHTNQIAAEGFFDPVKEYLEALHWDGISRVDKLLSTYFDAPETPYVSAVIRKTLCAAVKRIYEPGCEFQHILVIKGKQNIGKSTFWRILGGPWFSDDFSLMDMHDGKSGAEKLRGNWIIEIGELAGLKRAELETVKSFIVRQEDKCRLSYRRDTEFVKRRSIIVGTTNSDRYLQDIENRRFWTIKVTKRNKDVILDRDQIWAEVMTLYKNEKLSLDDDLYTMAKLVERDNIDVDERIGLIQEFLEVPIPPKKIWDKMDYYDRYAFCKGKTDFLDHPEIDMKDLMIRETISALEIWAECFGENPSKISRRESNAIMKCVTALGWEKEVTKRINIYGTCRCRLRPGML